MLFNKIIEKKTENLTNPKLNKRKAVRAVIFDSDSNNNCY